MKRFAKGRADLQPLGNRTFLGFSRQERKFLIGLVRDRRIRIVGLDLRIKLGRLRRIFRGVVLRERKHNDRFWHKHRGFRHQFLVQLQRFIGLPGAVVKLGEFELRCRRKVLVFVICKAPSNFLASSFLSIFSRLNAWK